MAITFQTYTDDERYGADYQRLRRFLLELGDVNYHFGRWDWMISHSYLEAESLPRIGIWSDEGEIVGIATYDTGFDGNWFFPMKPGYDVLRRDMIAYAERSSAEKDKAVRLMIRDGDGAFQSAAADRGYIATQDKDCDAVYDIDVEAIRYDLPDGFSITSMRETYDLYQYGRVLWKGFNHELDGEGEYAPKPEELEESKGEFERPNVNMDLKIAVVAPDGNFVSYCGMWQDAGSDSALVEPVATDPAYRKMGLGKAAVLEAIRRCGHLGAKRAFVGSSQQFYYSIGFKLFMTSTFWTRKV